MNLRPALLPALGVFAAAARHQNFAHAAEELHLTASAVSHHVRKLEANLGVVLFQRNARGVTLTAEGRQLADAATAAMTDIAAVAANLHHSGSITSLRISTLHSLTYCWLLPRLPRFLRRASRHTHQYRRQHCLDPLRRRWSRPRHPPWAAWGLTAHHLMDDELFPVASPRWPASARSASPRQIANLPLVSDMALQGWRDWFRAAGVRGLDLPPMHSSATVLMRCARRCTA